MKDILSDNKAKNIMSISMQIVVFSLAVELIGAFFIYNSMPSFQGDDTPLFFAVFHSISAFCNAGFSLMTDGLTTDVTQYNYSLQWAMMLLIVFGGLGYGIASNFIQYVKNFIINLFRKKDKIFMPRVITLNTKIVVFTTLILIFGGAAFFMLSEQATILAVRDTFFGKFTTAMFSSITTRTAGFSTVDITALTVPGLFIMILLMWIGASPNSTGGGIKTSTFALSIMNVFSIAKGKENIEIGTRRIPKVAVQKAFSIMVISLMVIGVGMLLILIFDPKLSFLEVAFESFSAFSTVGLSMGITQGLSNGSKLVLIFLMIIGRVGLMNVLIGVVKKRKTSQYTYPEEKILIN